MKKNTLSKVFGVLGTILGTFVLVLGCTTKPTSDRDPADAGKQAAKPKHYIMTLHGIRGNEVSYGDFHSLIKTHLEQIDPAYEVVTVNMTYQIARADYSIESAGNEVKVKLGKAVPELNDNDIISIVAYSMGGQVGLAWYFESLKDPNYRKYADHLKHFVGLGSAYWGAKEAGLLTSDIKVLKDTIKFATIELRNFLRAESRKYLGETVTNGLIWVQGKTDAQIDTALAKLKTIDQIQKFYDANIRTQSAVKVSFNELKGLSLGGVGATSLRLGLMNNTASAAKVKWTTISPLVQCFKSNTGAKSEGCEDFQNPVFKYINDTFFKTYFFGYKRRETDNAVITPSGNTQFISILESDPNYAEGKVTEISQSKYAVNPAMHTHYFTEALHATVVGAADYDKTSKKLSKLGDTWSGLAEDVVLVYNQDCATLEKCAEHKSYKYVLTALADCDRENSTCTGSGKSSVLNVIYQKDKVAIGQSKLKSELHGFTLELNLRLPKGYDLSSIDDKTILKYVQFENERVDNKLVLKSSVNSDNYIEVVREKELAAALINKMTGYVDQDQLKVNLTGLFIPKNDSNYNSKSLENGTAISFKVALPGIRSRVVNAIVRPYHSTYVDLKMSAQ